MKYKMSITALNYCELVSSKFLVGVNKSEISSNKNGLTLQSMPNQSRHMGRSGGSAGWWGRER